MPRPVERLETRDLLAVVVTPINEPEGFPLIGQVATFAAADVQGSPARATIAWGDGHVSAGTVTTGVDGFSVTGANTYAVPGTFPVSVTVTGSGGSPATGQGQATITALTLLATGTTITPVAGEPFTGAVASFNDAYPSLGAANYVASVDWGDGHSSVGTVVPNRLGGFNVVGTHVYESPGASDTVTVTVVRSLDNQKGTATGTAIVVNESDVLSGHLDPLSDTGVSNTDGITAINQPTFLGTAAPFAVVTVYVRRTDQAQPVALGQAVAGASGLWQLPIGPLPDGAYTVLASETPPAGQASPMVSLTPRTPLVIDTAPITAHSASYNPGTGLITVVVKNGTSGLNLATLLNPTNYALAAHGGFRINPSSVTIVSKTPISSPNPVIVGLRFNNFPAIRRSRPGVVLALGGVADSAGNILPLEYLGIAAGAIQGRRVG